MQIIFLDNSQILIDNKEQLTIIGDFAHTHYFNCLKKGIKGIDCFNFCKQYAI